MFILLFSLGSLICTATTYYVKSGGNDALSGTSDQTALAHHPWMTGYTGSVVLKPGDSVLMKRGNTWTISNPLSPYLTVGQSGTAGKYITTSAYGTGSKPVINISTNTNQPVILINGKSYLIFDNLEITHHSSSFTAVNTFQNGIYINDVYTQAPHDIIITDCKIHNIPRIAIYAYGNSFNITIGDTGANEIASSLSHSNNIYDFGYGGVVLCGGNKATMRSDFRVYYNYIHDPSRTDFPGDCYPIQLTANQDDSDMWPHYSWLRYNFVENAPKYTSIGTHGASYLYIQDNHVKNSYRNIFVFADKRISQLAGLLDNIYIERNILENPSNPEQVGAFVTVTSQSVVPSNIFIRDNNIFFSSKPVSEKHAGIRIDVADGLEISGNKLFNGPDVEASSGSPILFYVKQDSFYKIRNALVKNNHVDNWAPVRIEGEIISGPVGIVNNIFNTGDLDAFPFYINSGVDAGADVRIYNNVLITNAPDRPGLYLRGGSKTGSSLDVKNNIIGSTVKADIWYIRLDGIYSGKIAIDYNLFWNSSKNLPFYLKNSFAEWQQQGYDNHSLINNNPLFRNLSGSFKNDLDFSLQNGSPAVDAGTNVGLTSDYAGNPIYDPPDIGAFEYVADPPPPLPVYRSSAVENMAPTVITMTYSLDLANIVPTVSAFTVIVNSSVRNVNSVSVSGKQVVLTLASSIAHGDAVTVAYTKPSSNPIQTPAGGQAASFSARAVKNNVAAIPAPVLVSASVENITPSQIELNFSLSLADIIPAASAFNVQINSAPVIVSSVSVTGMKVMLTLPSPVLFGDKITISYTEPSNSPLQTITGGKVTSFFNQTVANKIEYKNTAPVINVIYEPIVFSGFISEIDAGLSIDPDNDILTYNWVVPRNIPVSSTSGSKIQFLSPMVDIPQTVNFSVNVSDRKTTVSKTIPVEIHPYKQELTIAEVVEVDASSFAPPNYPLNITDDNVASMWAAKGDNQWLILKLKEPFKIQHIKISFGQDNDKEYYFDVLGSEDMISWDPIILKSNSCSFSGNLQVFNFPPSKSSMEYSYIKLVGHGNSINSWNYISEFKILGYPANGKSESTNTFYKIYPNPARDLITISAVNSNPALLADHLRIITMKGSIIKEEMIDPGLHVFTLPINLKNGIYIIQMLTKSSIIHSMKLIVRN